MIKKISLVAAIVLCCFCNACTVKPLEQGNQITQVDADEVIGGLGDKTVQYKLAKDSPGDILVKVRYRGDLPELAIADVTLSEENHPKDGEVSYSLSTDEGWAITITFWYTNSILYQAKLGTTYSPSPSGDAEKVLTLKSKKGYPIDFTFIWKDEKLMMVKVRPRQNPYASVRP